MKVIAATGIKVPMETQPRSYVTDAEAVDVPDSAYYLRRVADGDLLPVNEAPKAEAKPIKGK